MLRKMLLPLGLLLSVFLLHAAAAEEKFPPASQWIPQDAVIAVEISKPKALLDAVLDEKVTKAVKTVPLYQKAVEQPGFQQFLQVVSFLEMQLGTDWKSALHKLADGGVNRVALCLEFVAAGGGGRGRFGLLRVQDGAKRQVRDDPKQDECANQARYAHERNALSPSGRSRSGLRSGKAVQAGA